MKYFRDSEVLRIEDSKLEIIWSIDDNIEVSIFSVIDGYESLIGKVINKNNFITKDYYKNKRCLYILKADNYHYEIVAERFILLDGTHEFRDLGGYKSEDGRRVKWNIFYRSDRISNISDSDINFIESLNVKNIFDLRSKYELKENPNPKIKGIKYTNLPMITDSEKTIGNLDMLTLLSRGEINSSDVDNYIIKYYKSMIYNNTALRKLIEYIENEDSLPVIFHSSAGKDRVGLSSAIILSILSVPRRIIKEDYLASNYYRRNINNEIIEAFKKKIKNEKKIKIIKSILEVKEEYIDAVFNEIDKKYCNIDNYLEKEYGLTRKKRKEIKNRLLY